MKKTDCRRNQELACAISEALAAAGFDCPLPAGWDESLYATITINPDSDDEEQFELRISDHFQPEGGGYSEKNGGRYGESDICVMARSGDGANLDWSDDGKNIIRVPLVRVNFNTDIPVELRECIQAVCGKYSEIFARRSAAAKKAAATRAAKKQSACDARIAEWHKQVRAELMRDNTTDINLTSGMPFAEVPPGTPDRKKRIAAAEMRIEKACQRLFAMRSRQA